MPAYNDARYVDLLGEGTVQQPGAPMQYAPRDPRGPMTNEEWNRYRAEQTATNNATRNLASQAPDYDAAVQAWERGNTGGAGGAYNTTRGITRDNPGGMYGGGEDPSRYDGYGTDASTGYQYDPSQRPQTPDYTMPSNGPLQDPGNNLVTPGWAEQAFNYTQNQWLTDPYQDQREQAYQQTLNPTQGEQWLNQNLGTLDGPGQGSQYWSQMQGQYMDPFAGEQFTREATQNFSPTGAAGAFNDRAQQSYDRLTNYSGAGNTQGQYNASAGALMGGTAGEGYLGQLMGQAGQNSTYGGPNLAAGQYAQTQGAFGDMPIADFDPFYDRARQLATQDYNRQSAGRGVYGSSEALSGVGNVITDIEAQRANRAFDAEMQRAQEQRMRQQLLGEQARMGDQSGIEGFKASLQGAETYGNIANNMGRLEIDRHSTLGTLANNADSQATAAQNANISGMATLGTIANNADTAETDRYKATTSAMSQADQNQLARMDSGANVAFAADDAERNDFIAQTNAAAQSSTAERDRMGMGADQLSDLSNDHLQRLESYMGAAQTAEAGRLSRQIAKLNAVGAYTQQVQDSIGGALAALASGDQAQFEQIANTQILPALQAAGLSRQEQQDFLNNLQVGLQAFDTFNNKGK